MAVVTPSKEYGEVPLVCMVMSWGEVAQLDTLQINVKWGEKRCVAFNQDLSLSLSLSHTHIIYSTL